MNGTGATGKIFRADNYSYLRVSPEKYELKWGTDRFQPTSRSTPSPHVLAPQHIGHVIWGATIANIICLVTAAIAIIINSDSSWHPWAVIGLGQLGALAIPFAYMSKRLGARIAADGVEATSD